jgi:hypothetical protein
VVWETEASEVVLRSEAGKVVRKKEVDRRRPPAAVLCRPRGGEEAWEAETDHRGR